MLGPFVPAVTDTQKTYWASIQISGKATLHRLHSGTCLQLGLRNKGNQAYSDYLSVLCLYISFILLHFVNTLEYVSNSSQML